MEQLVKHILANNGAAVRVWLTEHTPTLLHGLITDAPLWVLGLLATFVGFGLLWASVAFVTSGFAGIRWAGKLITRPLQALHEIASPDPPATRSDITQLTTIIKSLVEHRQHYHDTTKTLGSNPRAWLDEEIVRTDLQTAYTIDNSAPAGAAFLLIPSESRFAEQPILEVVAINTANGVGPGPSDERMYLVQPLGTKQPYNAPDYLPPYRGKVRDPIQPDANGNFSYFPVFSREFCAAHMYGTARWVLQIWETYFEGQIEWHFKNSIDRLELIPFLDLENNVVTGFGFMEAGFITDQEHYKWPLSLNFDVIAHEMGHLILFSKLGIPDTFPNRSEYIRFVEASCDLIALISSLHFESTLDRLTQELIDIRLVETATIDDWMPHSGNEIEQLTSAYLGIMIDIFIDNVRTQTPSFRGMDHASAKATLAWSRDLIGRMLAETWTRMPKEDVNAASAYRILNDIDRENFGSEYNKIN